jgi:hypothetical protein
MLLFSLGRSSPHAILANVLIEARNLFLFFRAEQSTRRVQQGETYSVIQVTKESLIAADSNLIAGHVVDLVRLRRL